MNFNLAEFEKYRKKAGVRGDVIKQIVNAGYKKSDNEKQDNANCCATVMAKCEELLDFDTIAEVMFLRACCKSGFRLDNARMIAREHADKSLEEKLALLGEQKYMGHPHLVENGDIYTGHCAGSETPEQLKCSCWRFNGCVPNEGKMPLSYCLCCAGHFRFHYQKALGVKLRVKKIVSSVFGEPSQYCSFLFEIKETSPKKNGFRRQAGAIV